MIIGITGTLGAGKGTVVAYLKEKGFAHYSVSGVLRTMLQEQGITAERKNLSRLANELKMVHAGGIVEVVLERARADGHEHFIIESLHRVGEAEYLKVQGGYLLGVDADLTVRYARIKQRQEDTKDEVTYEQFVADTEREEEGVLGDGPNIRAVLQLADGIVMNDSDVATLRQRVDIFLEKIGYGT